MKMKSSIAWIGMATMALALTVQSAPAALLVVDASADTYLRSGTSFVQNNYGASTQLLAGAVSATDLAHGLLRFDLSGLPAGAIINSVTLTTVADGNDPGSQSSLTLNVFELVSGNSGWVEGTEAGTVSTGGAAWRGKSWSGTAFNQWAGGTSGAGLAGTDYINTSLASFTGNPQTITGGTLMDFASSTAFADAVSNRIGDNLNLILLNDGGVRNFFRIRSGEASGGSFVASLNIDYTAVPEPLTVVQAGLAGLTILGWRRFSRGRSMRG